MTLFYRIRCFFDDRPSTVNLSKRFGAYLIDWFLGALIMMFPICLLWLSGTHDMDNMSSVNLFKIAASMSYSQAYLAAFLGIVFALFYYVVIPWKIFPGQTLGKRAMGFKIVKMDESNPDLATLVVRQIIGIMILEGCLYNVSNLWHSLLSLLTGLNFTGILLYEGIIVSVVSALIGMKFVSHRMLHDYIAKTKVTLL